MPFRDAIWESLLTADFNTRYWGRLTRYYHNLDKWSKIFLAIMASSTVASWGFWSDVPKLWKALSGFSALVAIALPILDIPKLLEASAAQKREWTRIAYEYDNLWLMLKKPDANTMKIEKKYRRTKNKEAELAQEEGVLPNKKRLLNICYKEVLHSRGLKS